MYNIKGFLETTLSSYTHAAKLQNEITIIKPGESSKNLTESEVHRMNFSERIWDLDWPISETRQIRRERFYITMASVL